MEQEPITRESFRWALDKAAATRGGDFVYPEEWKVQVNTYMPDDDPASAQMGCVYYKEGVGAACIIGFALEALGVDVKELQGGDRANWWGADDVLFHEGVHDSILVRAALEAQRVQDSGGKWEDAVKAYDEELARLEREDARG
jgi:hypothetical protein